LRDDQIELGRSREQGAAGQGQDRGDTRAEAEDKHDPSFHSPAVML